jgi:N-acetylmuramic acid 6-phosphate etherase
MVRLGRVYKNWMVDVSLANHKLRGRGLRILREAAEVDESKAAAALDKAHGNLRLALVMLKAGVDATTAKRRLRQAEGDLRKALGERI